MDPHGFNNVFDPADYNQSRSHIGPSSYLDYGEGFIEQEFLQDVLLDECEQQQRHWSRDFDYSNGLIGRDSHISVLDQSVYLDQPRNSSVFAPQEEDSGLGLPFGYTTSNPLSQYRTEINTQNQTYRQYPGESSSVSDRALEYYQPLLPRPRTLDHVMSSPSASRPRKRSFQALSDDHSKDTPLRKRNRISITPAPGYELDIEDIDLAAGKGSAQELLEKERQELVKTQQSRDDDDRPKRFGELPCIICLDNFTNLTTTACGHVFCHECLTQALIQGEKTNDRNTGNCPMCRKPLKRATKGHVIPLALMTRKKYEASPKVH